MLHFSSFHVNMLIIHFLFQCLKCVVIVMNFKFPYLNYSSHPVTFFRPNRFICLVYKFNPTITKEVAHVGAFELIYDIELGCSL